MTDKLLRATARAFEDGRSLDGEFLRDNNVSADDCLAWMTQMAAIIDGYLSAPKDVQNLILAAGVSPTAHMASLIWAEGLRNLIGHSMSVALKHLDRTENKIYWKNKKDESS